MVTENKIILGTGDQPTTDSISAQEQEILRSVRELKYGTVEVTVHDQFIVEVSKREKIRFQKQSVKSEPK
ncbi:MAG: YezD family protein [Verrucomicrobiales bacterium]|jgi:hypothetical protein|nr:YezD family protein [Verrucomicrobiales bacterium]